MDATSSSSMSTTEAPVAETTDAPWQLGRTRICDAAGYRGTVLFVGPVASSKNQIYVGVEWDDASRGKHNGSIRDPQTGQVHSYFQTTTHPTSGSLVPLHKVRRGVSLTPTLLYAKYVPLDSGECIAPHNIFPNAHVQTTSSKATKPIYFLGEHQIRHHQQIFRTLDTLSLRGYQISAISVEEMQSWVQKSQAAEGGPHTVVDLDLAGNLLYDWQSLGQVVDIFPTLQRLSLAANRLGDWDSAQLRISSAALRHLNVRGTHITQVRTVWEIGQAFPNLQELILANNDVAPVRDNADAAAESDAAVSTTITSWAAQLARVFANLVYLDCSNCTLQLQDGWNTNRDNAMVLLWSQLPKLQSLSLDDNPGLTAFPYCHSTTDASPPILYYPALQHLQFANTGVAHWDIVVSTWQQHLPRLRSLRFRSCPLVQSLSPANVRQRLIAECPHLAVINATLVTEPERREAARGVLRRGALDAPSYEHWAAHYPEFLLAAPHSGRDTSPTSTLLLNESAEDDLASFRTTQFSIIPVVLRCMAAASCTMPPWTRRLPTQLTLGKLKALCARHFGVDIERQRLVFCAPDAQSLPQEMEGNDHTLHYFGVPEGAEILVHEIDE